MKPVLKYPGAKWSIAQWIISHFPPHTTYLEPYSGSAAVFFNKKPSVVETLNDVDGHIINFFKTIRDYPEELARLIEFTPWSRREYEQILTYCHEGTYLKLTGDPLEDARRFLVRLWQGRGAKTSDRTGWRHDVQGRKGSSSTKEWKRLPDLILKAAERLKQAQIENQPALKIIQRYAYPEVLIYVDPPYPLSTRSKRMYANEMTDNDHLELINILDIHPGPVILSGYGCQLYDDRLKHWQRVTRKALAEAGRIREEVLWINPLAAEYNKSLFGEVIPCQT